MAKKKKSKNLSSVKRKNKKKLKLNISLKLKVFIAGLLIFLLGIIIIYAGTLGDTPKVVNIPPRTKLKPLTSHPKVIIYVSVTPTPSPTPVPLTGFCLRVPVLMYHHIQPESVARDLGQTSLTVDNATFDQQMGYLAANGYTTLWANELVSALISHAGLPSKSVVITMDDGYADNHTYALPVLEKYHLKANLMLSSGLVGSNQDMLTWSQIQDMKNSGVYYFTNHTWSHYAISGGPQDKIESEIDTAQAQIQQYTGQSVNLFTYPYGAFSGNAIQTLQRKGYVGAFSEIPGQYQCDSFLMTLHRTRIGNSPLSYYGL